jgi:hypothetical protein
MLKLIYENSQRIGTGFSELSLEDGGFQPGLRTYDVSDRDRHRGWVVVTVTPTSTLDFTFSVAAARDRFKGEGHDFGLLDNNNTVVNVGVNVSPTNTLRLGGNYGRDTYHSFQKSRSANPPGTDYGSWYDPNRDWVLNGDEKVNTATLYVDLLHAIGKSDIRFSYDYSDSNNAYLHGGPKVEALKTGVALTPADPTKPCAVGLTSCFEALPPVTNAWQRLRADFRYMFTNRVGLALTYAYERLGVSDYATIDLPGQPGTPRIDYLGEISTGYGSRPYKASTGFVRILYLF